MTISLSRIKIEFNRRVIAMYQQLNPLFFEIELRGRSLEQITARFGEPWHTEKSSDLMLHIWRQGEKGEYFMVLLFRDGICLGRFDEGREQLPV